MFDILIVTMIAKDVRNSVRVLSQRKQLWLEISVPAVFTTVVGAILGFFDWLERGLVLAKFYRWTITIVAGVGLGLGYSLVAYGNPARLQAQPEIIHKQYRLIELVELRIGETSFSVERATPRITHLRLWHRFIEDERFGALGASRAVVVADMQLSQQSILPLHTEIVAVGSNNGLYHYKVTEIRHHHLADLPSVVAQYPTALLLYNWSNVVSEEATIVIAQQQR